MIPISSPLPYAILVVNVRKGTSWILCPKDASNRKNALAVMEEEATKRIQQYRTTVILGELPLIIMIEKLLKAEFLSAHVKMENGNVRTDNVPPNVVLGVTHITKHSTVNSTTIKGNVTTF